MSTTASFHTLAYSQLSAFTFDHTRLPADFTFPF